MRTNVWIYYRPPNVMGKLHRRYNCITVEHLRSREPSREDINREMNAQLGIELVPGTYVAEWENGAFIIEAEPVPTPTVKLVAR